MFILKFKNAYRKSFLYRSLKLSFLDLKLLFLHLSAEINFLGMLVNAYKNRILWPIFYLIWDTKHTSCIEFQVLIYMKSNYYYYNCYYHQYYYKFCNICDQIFVKKNHDANFNQSPTPSWKKKKKNYFLENF